jgi:hypothetical protein
MIDRERKRKKFVDKNNQRTKNPKEREKIEKMTRENERKMEKKRKTKDGKKSKSEF